MIHFISSLAFAASSAAEPQYGPEFTFLINLDPNSMPYAEVHLLREAILRACPDCRVSGADVGRHIFNLKFRGKPLQIKITADPSVAEVTVTKMTSREWKGFKVWFQQIVFETIQAKGFSPHEWRGAGHINIGIESFKNAEHLKKFIIFFLNHPEISYFMGHFSSDFQNAKHLLLMNSETKKDFIKRIVRWKSNPVLSDLQNRQSLLTQLSEVYLARTDLEKTSAGESQTYTNIVRNKNTALSPRDILDPEEARLEVRTAKPQNSVEDWVKETEFFDRLIAYVETEPVDFDIRKKYTDNPKENFEKMAELFLEIGFDPERFDFLVLKEHRRSWSAVKKRYPLGQCKYLF